MPQRPGGGRRGLGPSPENRVHRDGIIFPWAVVFEKLKNPGQVLAEMIIFIVILAVGLIYAWKKKVLEWV